jgi:hypothetical protein
MRIADYLGANSAPASVLSRPDEMERLLDIVASVSTDA